jgi:hypothetical protein
MIKLFKFFVFSNSFYSSSSTAGAIQIGSCDPFQFRVTSDIINHFDTWQDSLDEGSARHNACTPRITVQHRKMKTYMP